MKTREDILSFILSLKNRNIALAISTGVGKSRIALEKMKTLKCPTKRILIVVPVNNLKDTWKAEIIKWNADVPTVTYEMTTYKSLHKFAGNHYNMVIFDEGHHISNRVLDIIKIMTFDTSMILSATLNYMFIEQLRIYMPDLCVYRIGTQEAIDSSILPDPQIILLPIQFNSVDKTEKIIKHSKAKKTMEIPFEKRRFYNDKTTKYIIPCTEFQYNLELDSQVDWYKRKVMGGNQALKNIWLQKAGERLRWLSSKKTPYLVALLKKLDKERTLTFCGSIEQTEVIGKHCIHSKNEDSKEILRRFNAGEIDHITAVAMLDEGENLYNCKVGIFANINASKRVQVQRVGRILRHHRPTIILVYFANSREEEIINKMISDYNQDIIHKVKDITEINI